MYPALTCLVAPARYFYEFLRYFVASFYLPFGLDL